MTSNFTPIEDLIKKYQQDKQAGQISKPKESEPVLNKTEDVEIKEVAEHKIEEEVRPYIKQTHETIELPPDLKKVGLQPASTSINFQAYQNVKLPISDDKIMPGLHAPITSSLRWLATLAIYILRKAHLAIRVVGGKAVRVIKN